MKTFLAIYIGMGSAMEQWNSLDEAERKRRQDAGMKAWGEWMATHQAAIVTSGGPLGKTKRASAQGIADIRNNLTGYVIIKAESHQAAVKMFEHHPHFSIFPGDSVEVMECVPIPGQ